MRAEGAALGEVSSDRVPLVTDDDDGVLSAKGLGSGEHVPEQGASQERVEHLGGARLHPGALTRGEDDHGGRAAQGHSGWLLAGDGGSDGRAERRIPSGAARRRAASRCELPGEDSNPHSRDQNPLSCP